MALDVKNIRYPSREDTWKGVERMIAEGWMIQGVKALAGGAYEAVFERACNLPPRDHSACSSARLEASTPHRRVPPGMPNR